MNLDLNEELLELVKQIVIQKYKNVIIYKFNPSIDDLMEYKFYKLFVEEKLYLVPLWHRESCFDGSGCEIISICEPSLPDNMIIDDDNNLVVNIVLTAMYDLPNIILNGRDITFKVGNHEFSIPLSNLYMKKEQYYRLIGKGLVNIKKDIYDLSDKSDIIVKITIC